MVVLAALVLLSVPPACSDNFVPELGPPLTDRCRNRDSNPDQTVSFDRDILEGIFKTNKTCVPCHDPKGEAPYGFQQGGLNLTSWSSTMAGGANSAADIVVPGEPCGSRLLQKVGATPPSGSRMPLIGPPLSVTQVMLIHDWIAEGALDN